MIRIEKKIPLPNGNGRAKRLIYLFADMEVEDSFRVAGDPKKTQVRLAAAANYFVKKRQPNWKFETHQLAKSARIWRVE